MSFSWPAMLFSLLLIPLFVLLYLRIQQRRRRLTATFSKLELEQKVENNRQAWRRHITTALSLVGLTVLLLAVARPHAVVRLPRVEGTVILAFDISGSMAADDLEPTRMEAAKTAAQNFIQDQPLSVQIGVVAFSDSGLSILTPTNDQEAILSSIARLEPTNGTSLASGILASLNTIAALNALEPPQYYSNLTPVPTLTPTPMPQGMYTSAVIILLTDGENNVSPDPLAAAQAAAERGVRIFTIGIGSPEGAILNIDGFAVRSRLDEQLLKQIAQITAGSYYNAESDQELHEIYNEINSQLVIRPEKMEITSLLAGAGVLIFLISGAFSLFWFSRLP